MSDRALIWLLVASTTVALLVMGARVDRANERINRLEHVRFVCHPIVGSARGDRVCVAP